MSFCPSCYFYHSGLVVDNGGINTDIFHNKLSSLTEGGNYVYIWAYLDALY